MDTRYIKTTFLRVATIMVVLATTFSVSLAAYAAPASPFVGHWQAIDMDGSDIRLSIAGPPNGPYQITWTESYISFCDKEAGIVRGVGWLNEEDINLLEADLHVECFTTGAATDFHIVWRYRPDSNTLISQYESNGFIVIWYRPGLQPPPLSTPFIVASEVGDWLWTSDFSPGPLTISIYDSLEPWELGEEPLWEGTKVADESGFVLVEPADHNLDLIPGNYLTVSDGSVLKDLVLEAITVDMFDVNYDFMTGTAPFGREVWVAAGPQEYQVGFWVDADGDTGDPEIGAWFADFTTLGDAGYDITEEMRPWSYAQIYDEDGDINEADPPLSDVPPIPTFVAYLPSTIVGYDWPIGDTIDISLNNGEYTAHEEVGNTDWDPTIVLFELGDFSMEAGDHIIMTDEVVGITKDVWVANLAVTDFDLNAGQVFGTYTYDPESVSEDYLWVWLYDRDGQVPTMNPDGTWIATFDDLSLGAFGGATQWDGDSDGTSIDFQVE